MNENYINDYSNTLSTGINNSTTSISVSDVASVSSGFRILIDSERMLVTAGGTTSTWTVTRGIEGSTAASHSASAVINIILTAGSLDQIRKDVNQIGTFANLPGSGMKQGDRYQCTDSVYEFIYDGSVWQPFIPGHPVLTLPPSSGWTWDNQGSSTIDSTYGFEYAVFLDANATSTRLRYRTAPSPSYTIKMLLRFDLSGIPPETNTGSQNEGGWVVGWRDSSGKLVTFLAQLSVGTPTIGLHKWNSSTSYGSAYSSDGTTGAGLFLYGHDTIWMALSDDNTNLKVYWSITGLGTPGSSNHWKLFDSRARTNFLSSPSQIFYGAYVGHEASNIAVLSWG